MANYFLSDKKDSRGTPFLHRPRSLSAQAARQQRTISTPDLLASPEAAVPVPGQTADTINEVSEPPSPEETEDLGPSMLTTMFKRPPPESQFLPPHKDNQAHLDGAESEAEDDQATLTRVSTVESRPLLTHRDTPEEANEVSPLLAARSPESQGPAYGTGQENGHHVVDLEDQKFAKPRTWFGRKADSIWDSTGARLVEVVPLVVNPKRWDRTAIWENVVVAPVACLPAVVVGLLLNILDALSYGEYLFLGLFRSGGLIGLTG